MSIKDLFNKPATFENAATGSNTVESFEFINTKVKKHRTFQPSVDFATASNFAKYGSAYEYYTKTIQRIYDSYPYDGSEREKILFELSSSYLDKWVFDNKYPKTTGYINFSYAGWGTLNGSLVQGYGKPTDLEYIYSRGGMHTASSGMEGKFLRDTFDKSVVYDTKKNRTITYDINSSDGVTIEFWLKKAAFDNLKTEKEVILDLWNGNLSSSHDYGRLTLTAHGTGTGTFKITLQSGSMGVFEQAVSSTDITVSSLSNWSHYALSLVSASNGITSRFYKNGTLDSKKTLGSSGFGDFPGLINGYIGALQTAPSGNVFHGLNLIGAGKLSASIDDFRFWKTRRRSEDINNNWYRGIGGGSNTDDANVKLGVYYKFNEGVVGSTTKDSNVLDYSGRIANGSWTGYSSGARSTSSAFTESGLVSSEAADPIIYSSHPNVINILSEMQNSGSDWDNENGSMLLNTLPQWIREEDEENTNNVKYLFQIISNYFDTLHSQITEIKEFKNKKYTESNEKPLPFSDRLLTEKGITVNNLFIDTNILEKFGDRDSNRVLYEKEVFDIKNLIYKNIYNNLEHIYKSKGTEKSIRNLLRCFGVDDELVKLNIYTDGGTHYFENKTKPSSLSTKYINFNKTDNFGSTIFQTSSVNNTNTFISGSAVEKLERYSAFTAEADIIIPYKVDAFQKGYFETPFVTASIFGMHQALSASASDYTWAPSEIANFQVYLIRDKKESKDAKFLLRNEAGTINLTSSIIPKIYDNQRWNLAVSVRPDKYGLLGNVVTSSNPNYTLEFYGVTHAFDDINSEFLLTASLNYNIGSSYLSNAKRVYAGAHLTNFTGSIIYKSDIKIGSVRMYEDYLDKEVIRQHNLDPTNYGLKDNFKPANTFPYNINTDISSGELIIFNWNFNTVTGSDSGGKYIIEDFSSGSTDTVHGWIDNIIRREHKGLGYGFPVSSTEFVSNESIYSQKKELPEISVISDSIFVKTDKQKYFITDDDVSDNFYAIEKSMYQAISEEMLNLFSTINEFNSLIGKPVNRYRMNYKEIDTLRRLFFDRVSGSLDFDRFSQYFKWIDSAVSNIVEDLFPVSSRYSPGVLNVIDSHILERNKYQNKFPLIMRLPIPEAAIRGHAEMNYNWKFGHAPPTATKAVASIVVTDSGGIVNGEVFRLVDYSGLSTTYTINGGTLPAAGGGSGGSATVGLAGVGGGSAGKIAAAAAIVLAINNTTDTAYKAVSDGVDTVTVTQGVTGEDGNRTNSDAITGVTVSNFINGNSRPSENCLWQRDRSERKDIPQREELRVEINKHSVVKKPDLFRIDGHMYTGSAYIFRTLTKPYKLGQHLKPTIHGGINYDINKDRNIIHNFVERAGHVSGGIPQNTFLAGQGAGDGVVEQQKCDDVLIPNLKKKVDIAGFVGKYTSNHLNPHGPDGSSDEYLFTFGAEKLPINIVSGSLNSGYNSIVAKHFHSSSIITNIHSDTTTFSNDVPMQGPFTNNWVGGHQHRHVDLNYYDALRIDDDTGTPPPSGLHNEYTREEAWQLVFSDYFSGSDGAFGFVGADYGGPYPDPARKGATLYRQERAKRPVNIKNIKTNTGGSPFFTNGNFTQNHEVVQSFGKHENNLYLRKNPEQSLYLPKSIGKILPLTTNPMTLVSQAPFLTGNVFGVHQNNRQPDVSGVTAAKASGSFSVYGINHLSTGSTLQITSSNQAGYVIENASLSGFTNVATGSNDINFIENLQAAIQASSSMTTSFTEVSSTVGPAPFLVAFPNSGVNHRVFMSGTYSANHFNNNPFSWAGWLYISQSNMSTGVIYSQNSTPAKEYARQIKYNSGTRVLKFYKNYLESGVKKYIEWVSPVITTHFDKWFHLTVTHNSSSTHHGTASSDVKMYINGQEVSTTRAGNVSMGAGFTANEMTGPYFLYNRSNDKASTAEFKGGMANVGTWQSVLTQTHVNEIYNGHVFTDYRTTPSAGGAGLRGYLPLTSSLTNPDYNVIGHNFSDGDKFEDVVAKTQSLTSSINVAGNIRFLTGPFLTKNHFILMLTASQAGAQYNGSITGSNTLFPTFFNFNNLVGGVNQVIEYDIVNAVITSSVTNTIISSRFSAPGGVEINSLGYLDVYSREYSVYNNMNFRNLTVRGTSVIVSSSANGLQYSNLGGSGEAGTMRSNTHLDKRETYKTLLSRHCAKFGADSVHANPVAESYVVVPSFHKVQRNGRKIPTDASSVLSPVLQSNFDNEHITSLIPQSDYQYTWVTSSLGDNYSVVSGKQRIYGYTPRDGILSSSIIIDGDSGFVPAINFPTASEIFGE